MPSLIAKNWYFIEKDYRVGMLIDRLVSIEAFRNCDSRIDLFDRLRNTVPTYLVDTYLEHFSELVEYLSDEGWRVNSLTFNGEDITDQIQQLFYIISVYLFASASYKDTLPTS